MRRRTSCLDFKTLISPIRAFREHGIAAVTIDRCLRLIAIRNDRLHPLGIAEVAHLFYHMRHPETPSEAHDSGSEVGAIRALEPPFVDLVEQNIRGGPWGQPITMEPVEKVRDLVMGHVKIFVQFDLDEFIRLASASGITLTPATGREIDEVRKSSNYR